MQHRTKVHDDESCMRNNVYAKYAQASKDNTAIEELLYVYVETNAKYEQ